MISLMLWCIDAFIWEKLGYFIYEAFALRNETIDPGIIN